MKYKTICCSFKFWGLNHSPEFKGKCRNCGRDYVGEVEDAE